LDHRKIIKTLYIDLYKEIMPSRRRSRRSRCLGGATLAQLKIAAKMCGLKGYSKKKKCSLRKRIRRSRCKSRKWISRKHRSHKKRRSRSFKKSYQAVLDKYKFVKGKMVHV